MATLRIPDAVPSPAEDCERIKKDVEGSENVDAIIKVLGRRNVSQRKMIRETYTQLYNKSLIDDLSSALFGDLREALILWTYDPAERDARLVNAALQSRKKGIRELQVIVEMACASPNHLACVRKAYCSLFNNSIEEDIVSNVSMPVQKILVSLLSSYWYAKELVDSAIANSEADILHEAIKQRKLHIEELVFMFSTRNFFQLSKTFQYYKQNYGIFIGEDIMGCGEGTIESLLKALIWCIESPEKHFAKVVRASMAGYGTDEDSLSRAIVSRAEVDLMKIREEYFNVYQSSLEHDVRGDTSGDYSYFLMTLLGARV